jgi:hypothetical protein
MAPHDLGRPLSEGEALQSRLDWMGFGRCVEAGRSLCRRWRALKTGLELAYRGHGSELKGVSRSTTISPTLSADDDTAARAFYLRRVGFKQFTRQQQTARQKKLK